MKSIEDPVNIKNKCPVIMQILELMSQLRPRFKPRRTQRLLADLRHQLIQAFVPSGGQK
jgi:hypothetical protein